MDGRTLPAPCPASSAQSLCGIRRDREGDGECGGDDDGDGGDREADGDFDGGHVALGNVEMMFTK